MPEYLTVKDVASLLRISEVTVARWVRRGYIRPVKIGHTLRFEKSKLLLQVEQHQAGQADTVIQDPSLG